MKPNEDSHKLHRWSVQLPLDKSEPVSDDLKDRWKTLSDRNHRTSSSHIVHIMKEELRKEGLL